MIKGKLFWLMTTICFFIFFCISVSGQDQSDSNKIAEISSNGGGVSWQIKVPHESATLTISAPNGEIFRREFKAGSIPVFSPVTKNGEFYGDGAYNYEIILTPVLSPELKEKLTQSRQNGNSSEVLAEFRRRGLLPKIMNESGTFTILNGRIIEGNKIEKESGQNIDGKNEINTTDKTTSGAGSSVANAELGTEDQVIPEDLIVQGSICVGLDCVNNENFEFDTIRMKENNTRLKFEDTSATAGFTSNDWQLTANDSANGGANKFSIDDIDGGKTPLTIIAGAPTDSFFVANTGKIGFRTSTPALDLHFNTSDTPAIRFEQNGSGGFTVQTWDVAGNDANFFIRDATNSSRLPFRIFPGAPTNSFRIEANGNVSIGNSIQYSSSGTSSVAPSSAQQFYGGQSVLALSNITTAVENNTFGVTTNGQTGFASFLINVPANLNIASAGASNIVYKIRYQDPDGTAANSLVRLDLVANNITTGARSTKVIFDSNTNAATGSNTVTVCQAVDTTYFNYATHATHIAVVLVGTAALTAKFLQIQVYKINSPC